MWMGEVWEPLWSLGRLYMYKEVRSTWDVTNVFRFVSFNEPLELWLHTEKKGDGVAEDQRKRSADGPAAADEVQTKNKKYDEV